MRCVNPIAPNGEREQTDPAAPLCVHLTGTRSGRRRQRDRARTVAAALCIADRDEARGGGLDLALELGEELIACEAGRDRIEHLDADGSGIAPHRPARPEQAGIERNRQAGDAHLRVEVGDAVFVARRRARCPARAFRKDDDLAAALYFTARIGVHRRERLRPFAAIDRDHAGLPCVPAEERDPHQLTLHDVGGVGKDQQQREGLPQRLMLGCDQQRTGRDLLDAAKLDLGAAHDPQQPHVRARPEPRDLEQNPSRHHQRRDRHDEMHEQIEIEQDVEEDGAQNEHWQDLQTMAIGARTASVPARRTSYRAQRGAASGGRRHASMRLRNSNALAAGLSPMRTLAKMYLTYSENISFAVAPLVHQGSARWRSVTTGNGSRVASGS